MENAIVDAVVNTAVETAVETATEVATHTAPAVVVEVASKGVIAGALDMAGRVIANSPIGVAAGAVALVGGGAYLGYRKITGKSGPSFGGLFSFGKDPIEMTMPEYLDYMRARSAAISENRGEDVVRVKVVIISEEVRAAKEAAILAALPKA